MRLRFGVVTASSAGAATVTLDGVSVEVTVVSGLTLTVGDTAVVMQDGRRLVSFGGIPPA